MEGGGDNEPEPRLHPSSRHFRVDFEANLVSFPIMFYMNFVWKMTEKVMEAANRFQTAMAWAISPENALEAPSFR